MLAIAQDYKGLAKRAWLNVLGQILFETRFDLDQTTGFCDPLSFIYDRSREEFRRANDDENDLGDLLYWCSRCRNGRACLCSTPSDVEWVPARLDGTGWELRALPMGWWPVPGWWLEHLGWWLEYLERMSTRFHDTGRKLRALPMGKVRRRCRVAPATPASAGAPFRASIKPPSG
jgi:hypothetical protein